MKLSFSTYSQVLSINIQHGCGSYYNYRYVLYNYFHHYMFCFVSIIVVNFLSKSQI